MKPTIKIIVCMLLIHVQYALAQPSIRLNVGSKWKVESTYRNFDAPPPPFNKTWYYYSLDRDTIYNGKIYFKIYLEKRGAFVTPKRWAGLIRQDIVDDKIYYYDLSITYAI